MENKSFWLLVFQSLTPSFGFWVAKGFWLSALQILVPNFGALKVFFFRRSKVQH
jgi:hypothetical protein